MFPDNPNEQIISTQTPSAAKPSRKKLLIALVAIFVLGGLLGAYLAFYAKPAPTQEENSGDGPTSSRESTTSTFLRNTTEKIVDGISESDFSATEESLKTILNSSEFSADEKNSALENLVLGYEKLYGPDGLRARLPELVTFVEETDSTLEKVLFLQTLARAYASLGDSKTQLEFLNRAKEIVLGDLDDEDVAIEGGYIDRTLEILQGGE